MEKILLYTQEDKHVSTITEIMKEREEVLEVAILSNALDFLYMAFTMRESGIALIDVDNPECENLKPVKLLKKLNPNLAMVFLSADGRYAVEAFEEGVSDYIRTPFSLDKIHRALDKAYGDLKSEQKELPYIKTFSSFEVLLHGRPIPWKSSKTKELLALLVDNRGASVSSEFIQKTLWPEVDEKKTAIRYHTTLHHLREKLKHHGIENLVEGSRGSLRIDSDKIQSDLFEFEDALEEGTRESYQRAFALYRGGYLEKNAYPWSTFSRIRIQLQFEQIWKYL